MQEKKLKTRTVILGIVLSLSLLGLSQGIAIGVSEGLISFGLSPILGVAFSGILYVALILVGLTFLCQKLFSFSLEKVRVLPVRLTVFGVFTALLLPLTVVALLYASGGQFEIGESDQSQYGLIIAQTVLFYALATGIVEEVIFRGMIFTLLEKNYSRKLALWLPSVLFGLLHIVGRTDDVISMLQVVVAGTLVGVLFTLVTLETGSVWSSALIHGIWNFIFVGDILHIGEKADSSAIINYTLSSKSPLITGGDFGVEASIWAILAYLVFALLAWRRIRQHIKKAV